MELFQHQKDALKKSEGKNTFAYFLDMGTGKSLISILKSSNDLPCLIITKNGPLKYNWVDEIKKWALNTKICLLDGSSEKKKNILEETSFDWYIVNYESVRLIRPQLEKLLLNTIILDESTAIKNPTAKQSKAIIKLKEHCKNRYLLTGTAVINNPLDLFNQFYFLDHNILGFESYWAYKCFYTIMEPRRFGANIHFKEVVGFKNLDILKQRMEPYCYIVKKEDCLDLPPKTYQTLVCDMPEEMAIVYKDLSEKLIADFKGKSIVANTVLTSMIRLQQLLGGEVVFEDGTKINVESPKMKILLDLIDSLQGQKFIVWARFVNEIRNIMFYLSKNKINCAAIYGDVPPAQRQENIDSFKSGFTQVLVCQQATAGYGINLVEAKYAVYYSNDYSLEHRQQSEDRIYRIGQTEKVTIYDLVVNNSIDVAILKTLKNKRIWQDVILTDCDIEKMLGGLE